MTVARNNTSADDDGTIFVGEATDDKATSDNNGIESRGTVEASEGVYQETEEAGYDDGETDDDETNDHDENGDNCETDGGNETGDNSETDEDTLEHNDAAHTNETYDPVRARRKFYLILAAAVVVIFVAAGIVFWRMNELYALEQAQVECASSMRAAKTPLNEYAADLEGEATKLSKLDPTTLKDPSTVQALKDIMAEEYTRPSCTANDVNGLQANAQANKQLEQWYIEHTEQLKVAIKAVQDSQIER
jgi:hypothetical protein